MSHSYIGQVDAFGVALGGSPRQKHAALVYQGSSGSYQLLHLATHYSLICEPLAGGYFLVPTCAFDSDELDYFAERAEFLARSNEGGIPYGFKYGGENVFSDSGKYSEEAGSGLTCATFVLAFFKYHAFDILDISSWCVREDDAAWQRWIVGVLVDVCGMTLEHAEHQLKLIGDAVRFRPEEVVSSVSRYSNSPIEFSDAVSYSAELLAEIGWQ